MLAKLPEAYRQYVLTGSDRLRQLDQEIVDVKAELNQAANPGRPLRRLAGRVYRGLRRLGARP